MTSRPAAPSRSPNTAAPRGSLALPLANARRSRHIILLLFSPYLELLSRQFRPRARPPSPVCVWYPQVRGTFVCVRVYVCVLSACVLGVCRGAERLGGSKEAAELPGSGYVSRSVISSLRAPRRQGRRPLLARDADALLGSREDPFAQASHARWS